MKIPFTILLLASVSFVISCDPQSGITKKSLEKFGPTPTPSVSPTPVEAPIDPADVIQVDTSVQGPTIQVNPSSKTNASCDKFNRVMINGSNREVTVKGACNQVTINGQGNNVTIEAAMEIVFNGTGNQLRYSRYANGQRPLVSGNKESNTTEKVAAPAAKKS
jgi:hypothetical protein